MSLPGTVSEAPRSATGPLMMVHKSDLSLRPSRGRLKAARHTAVDGERARRCVSIALGNVGDGETGG
jgi:hypothetical protein